jgi:hypothetical protein
MYVQKVDFQNVYVPKVDIQNIYVQNGNSALAMLTLFDPILSAPMQVIVEYNII